MNRKLLITLVALLAAVAMSDSLLADWPAYDGLNGHSVSRGDGNYLNPIKLGAILAILLLWIKTTDWVSQDCQRLRLPYAVWTSVAFFPGFIGFFLAVMIPNFAVGYTLYCSAYLVPTIVYVFAHNKAAEDHQKVLTPDHLRYLFAIVANKVGIKMAVEKQASWEQGPAVDLLPMGGETDADDQANLLNARHSIGFVTTKQIVADAFDRRAERVMLDFTEEAVSIRYQIDGVWHDGEPRDRESTDAALDVLKTLAALDVEEHKELQQGKMGVTYEDHQCTCLVKTQGSKKGERLSLHLTKDTTPFANWDDLGMRTKMQEKIQEALAEDTGLVIFTSMPAGGLSSTVKVALRGSDRYMRDYVAIDDCDAREEEVENVDVDTFNRAAGETPADILPGVLRRHPNVVIVRDLDLADAKTAEIVCNESAKDKLVISSLRGRAAVDALLRMLKLGAPPKEFSKSIAAIVNERLVRKLCDTCKETYAPSSDLLKKLGIPAGKVKAFYRPPQEPQEVCADCEGIGYRDRTAIYELLLVDDSLRRALLKSPDSDTLRRLSRKAGNRSLQEEGVLLVIRGVTSLPEMMRVLKQ